jgi:hypothetical protein
VQAPVAVVGGGRLPAGQLVGDDLLDVLTPELTGKDWLAVGLAVGGQEPGGVGVGLDGPGHLFSASSVAAEAPVEDQEVASRQLPVDGAGSVDDIVPSLGCGGAAGYGQRAPVSRVRDRRHPC